MSFYTPAQRQAQEMHDTQPLADRMEAAIVTTELPDVHIPFVTSRDFFFLSTVNERGEPTVSYKGGPVGVLDVVDSKTIRFPSYDGNGMYLTVGNIDDTARIGILLIDFETPTRLRIQATATTSTDPGDLELFPGAQRIVTATIDSVWVNCARYIHKHERVEQSPYVPADDGSQPHPSWKRIDAIQDVLPDEARARTDAAGGTITGETYTRKLLEGTS